MGKNTLSDNIEYITSSTADNSSVYISDPYYSTGTGNVVPWTTAPYNIPGIHEDLLDEFPEEVVIKVKKLMEMLGVDVKTLHKMAINYLIHSMKNELENEL